MTDFPDLKIKALVNFPSNAIGGTGVDVTKVDGNFVVDLAYDDFAPPAAGITDPSHQTALLWNSVTGLYTLTPVSLLGGGGGVPEAPANGTLFGRKDASWTAVPAGLPEAPNDGLQYARQSLAWSTVAAGMGSGNVIGPGSAVADDIAVYNGGTGTVIKDGGRKVSDLALLTQAVRYDAVQALTVTQQAQGRSNIAVPGANVAINGDFRVNQTGYVSAAVLATGAYGHDQWKAGAAGGDYSFTQLKSSTQITIASGKSLIQPIEDANVAGGSYVLSWTGTAQARAGVNTLTPSGAYAASPLLIAGQTAGTVMSIEFNAGTLGTVKLEIGALATPFVMRPYDQELATCKRYWEASYDPGTAPGTITAASAVQIRGVIAGTESFQVRFSTKCGPPSITIYNPVSGASGSWRDLNAGADRAGTMSLIGLNGCAVDLAGCVATNIVRGHFVANSRL